MAIPLLICDDSAMSRKMVQRSLPPEWDVDVTMAKDGIEGLEVIRAGKGEVVFLDLTMPNLDGYGVLESIKKEQLKCLVIVISADIQPEAQEKVLGLGALAFIKKPINSDKLKSTLKDYGLLD